MAKKANEHRSVVVAIAAAAAAAVQNDKWINFRKVSGFSDCHVVC